MSAVGQLYSLRGTLRVAGFRLFRHRPSLDRAITHLDRAAARLPADHPDRPLVLATLGECLLWRYERTTDPADLDAAIHRLREGDTPASLAAALRSRFLRYADVQDLDEAIAAAGQDDAASVTNVALALLARYEHTAARADLFAALRAARTPVAGALHRGPRLGALIEVLGSLHQHTDDRELLADAIAAGRAALATLSWTDPNRAVYAAGLSAVLRLSDDPALRHEAVPMAEEALRGSPPAHVDHGYRLATLSMALFTRHLDTGDRDDLRWARDRAEEAVTVGRNRPLMLLRVGLLARRWFDVTGEAAALDRGEQAVREAIDLVGPEHPSYGPLRAELAELLLRAGREAEARDLLVEAVQADGPVLTLHNGLRAATRLAELAGDSELALLGYRRAIALLPSAAWPGLRRPVREARLAEAPRATDAAALALRHGDPRLALDLLEAGRSVIWAQQPSRHTDLSRLRTADPALAGRLDEIRAWFEDPDVP